jgi:hypothetical protein
LASVRAIGVAEVQRLAICPADWIFAEFYVVSRRNGFSDASSSGRLPEDVSFSDWVCSPGNRAVLPLGVLHFVGSKLLFAEANRIILSDSTQVKGATTGEYPPAVTS